jgi:hypothetical protein
VNDYRLPFLAWGIAFLICIFTLDDTASRSPTLAICCAILMAAHLVRNEIRRSHADRD